MVWNKKGGWQFKVILSLLLLLLVGGVLIHFVGGVYFEWMLSMFSQEKAEREICSRSIELNAKRLSVKGVQMDPFVDVRCKVIPLKIKEKDPEKIKKILADRLYWIWKDFGKGRKELFEHAEGTFCKLRYAPISFENEVYVDNFIEYLAKEKPDGETVSYWEYITGSKLEGDMSELRVSDKIRTEKDYAAVFMITKKGFWANWLGSLGVVGGGVAGKIIGGVVGGIVALIPLPGARVVAVSIIVGSVLGGAAAGGVGGYVLGTSYEDFTTNLALVPYDEIVNLGCEH